MIKNEFAKVRNKILKFLRQEEGQISKHSILTIGAMVGTAAVASVLVSKVTDATVTASVENEGAYSIISGTYT